MQAAEPRHLALAPTAARRALWLALLFAAALVVLIASQRQPNVNDARWPSQPNTFAVDGWAVGPETVEALNGNHYITRGYRGQTARASLSITTSPEAKSVYRAGAAVPFLGNGYTAEDAPPDLVPQRDTRGAVIVRRESELGLLLYAYGERRGVVGNGVPGWALVAFDAVVGRPNDYYLMRLYAPLTELDSVVARDVAALADTLFPRLAAWYGA